MDNEYYVGKLNFKPSVKLLVLTPIAPSDGNDGPFPLPPRAYLLATTRLDEIYCSGAPRAIKNAVDREKVKPMVVAKIKWAESQGYDAVVINCMLDPGVPEAKRAVQIPVVGIREANRALASLVGKYPAYIYPSKIPVLELATDEEKTFRALVRMSRWVITKRGADVIIPNCGYLGGMAQRLQAELGVPVLANLDVGLKLAELLAVFGVLPKRDWVKATWSSKMLRFGYLLRHLVRGWI
jgi:allantoin racemase